VHPQTSTSDIGGVGAVFEVQVLSPGFKERAK
jgi:hypothetical protein